MPDHPIMMRAPVMRDLTSAAAAIEDLVATFYDNLVPAIDDCEDMYGIPADDLVELRSNETLQRRLARALVGRLLLDEEIMLETNRRTP